MDMQPIKSSSIRSIGYDEDARVLQVEFLNCDVFQYRKVPQRLYARLMDHDQPERFLDAWIKKSCPGSQVL